MYASTQGLCSKDLVTVQGKCKTSKRIRDQQKELQHDAQVAHIQTCQIRRVCVQPMRRERMGRDTQTWYQIITRGGCIASVVRGC